MSEIDEEDQYIEVVKNMAKIREAINTHENFLEYGEYNKEEKVQITERLKELNYFMKQFEELSNNLRLELNK